jgi:hypothetical protein
MTVFLQLIGGRDADHTPAENDYPHDVTPCDSDAMTQITSSDSAKIRPLHLLVIE